MHSSLRKLKYHRYESWKVVFHAPEDERWVIVKDAGGEHGLQHQCWKTNPDIKLRYRDNGACAFCGDVPPESLEGFLTLVEWDR